MFLDRFLLIVSDPSIDKTAVQPFGPVLIVVGIKKEKEKNSQKGKKKRERKGFP